MNCYNCSICGRFILFKDFEEEKVIIQTGPVSMGMSIKEPGIEYIHQNCYDKAIKAKQ